MDDEITIVSGLPRSGTSLMMQMLQAGGMLVATDGVRAADEDNPRGYFELEAVKRLRYAPGDLLGDLRGKVVKMISALLYDLPRGQRFRVIVMQRRLPEVLVSQRVMLERRSAPVDAPDERILAALERELSRLHAWLASRPDVPALWVDYNELVSAPRPIAEEVKNFLGRDIDSTAMAAVVDPALYRRRTV